KEHVGLRLDQEIDLETGRGRERAQARRRIAGPALELGQDAPGELQENRAHVFALAISVSAIASLMGRWVASSSQRYSPMGFASRNTYRPSSVTMRSIAA